MNWYRRSALGRIDPMCWLAVVALLVLTGLSINTPLVLLGVATAVVAVLLLVLEWRVNRPDARDDNRRRTAERRPAERTPAERRADVERRPSARQPPRSPRPPQPRPAQPQRAQPQSTQAQRNQPQRGQQPNRATQQPHRPAGQQPNRAAAPRPNVDQPRWPQPGPGDARG